jgi:2-oxoisovalerate dehydrogenase E1 component beta subunit
MAQITMAKALNTALRDAMEADDRVVLLGEDVGTLGGVFRITDGLLKDFGEQRVMDTPLAESAIMGVSIGLALRGYRPVPEMQFDGFSYPALDQIISHLAKYRNRSAGCQSMPVVCRIPYGGAIGAVEHHSESPETIYCHTAGLKVVTPSSSADAYSLLRQSIESDDPVIFLEPKRRYWAKQEVELPVETEPIGRAKVLRQGSDLTLVAYGPMVKVALDAAEAAEEEGVGSLEVIDLRSLVPLDEETLVASAARTGRMVVVHEAPQFLGMGAEIAARVSEAAFFHLESPVLRCAGLDIPYPPARLEEAHLPGVDRVLWTVQRSLDF